MPYSLVSLEEQVQVPALIPYEYFRDEFLYRFKNYLHEFAYMQKISLKDNSLDFSGPPFRFVWNGWNMFNPVSNGQILILQQGKYFVVQYRIYFWEFFVYSLLFSTIAVYGFFPDAIFRFLYLLLVWALFIFHSLWVKNRLEKFIKTLGEQVTEDYLDEQRKSNRIVGQISRDKTAVP